MVTRLMRNDFEWYHECISVFIFGISVVYFLCVIYVVIVVFGCFI